jgi:DNA polymerase-3 subunit gamma/tau
MFILATTEFHKVLPTIVSRCQSFHFRRLTLNAIAAKLKVVCEQEGIDADDDTLVAISRAAGGSLRDAENILQQLIASRGRRLRLDDVRAALGIGDEAFVLRLVASFVARDLSGGLRVLHKVSDEGIDIRNFGRQVVSTLRDVMLVQSGCDDIVDGGAERLQELRAVAQETTTADVARAARRFSEIAARDAFMPLLALELAYVDSVIADSGEQKKDARQEVGAPATKRAGEPMRALEPGHAHTHPKTQGRAASQRTGHPAALSPSQLVSPVVADAIQAAGAGHDANETASESTAGVAPAATEAARTAQSLEDGDHSAPQAEEAPAELELGELGRVRSTWKEYVDSLRGLGSAGNLDAFLRSACEPVSLEDDVLVLRFAYEFHKSKIEDPKYCHVVEERLQEFYGRPFKVSCVLETPAGAPVSPAPARREGLVDAAVRMGARPKKRD